MRPVGEASPEQAVPQRSMLSSKFMTNALSTQLSAERLPSGWPQEDAHRLWRRSRDFALRGTMRHFSVNDYNKSRDAYTQGWKIVDDTLYRLCRDHPSHDDRAAVNAKILIIGRTYATGIERKVATTGVQGSSISQVADFFFMHRKEIDEWFLRLAKVFEPLASSNISEILAVHGLISKRLTHLTRRKQLARSFVSKYLHFHNSAVPIYDSVASGFLRGLVPLRRIRDFQIPVPDCADPEYADYVRRFAHLYQTIASHALPVTVRSLDSYLISSS